MISFDSDRSKKRRWMAEKQVEICRMLDIPAKAVIYDGFTCKGWQQDELSGGRVTAPMGAVVARVNGQEGFQVAVADYWAGAFSAQRDAHGLKKDGYVLGQFTKATAEQIEDLGYASEPFYPLQLYSHDGLMIYLFPTPGITPFYGESFDITYKGIVSLNSAAEGEPESYTLFKDMYERSRTFYAQDNTGLQRRSTVFLQTSQHTLGVFGTIWPYAEVYSLCQQMNQEQQVFSMGIRFNVISGVKAAMYRTSIPSKFDVDLPETYPVGETLPLSYMIPDGLMPTALRSIMLDETQSTANPTCTYAYENEGVQALLVVVNASDLDYYRDADGAPIGDLTDYYDANPGTYNWRFFFSFWDGTSVSVHNVNQFGSLLESLSTEDPAISDIPTGNDDSDLPKMLAVLQRVSSVWPNQHPDAPYDSAMFHAHNGNVYTWSRLYGMLCFSPNGLTREPTVSVPTIATTEVGCRPEVFYSGTYDAEPLYICFANKVNVNILEVDVGSPFTDWLSLPDVPEGYALIQCRPVMVTPTQVSLIGIAKKIYDPLDEVIEGEPYEKLFFTSFSVRVLEGETLGETVMPEWNIQSKLPFGIEEYTLDCYQVGLFGDGVMVNELRAFKSPPPVLSQMPWTPLYSIYDTLWDFEL